MYSRRKRTRAYPQYPMYQSPPRTQSPLSMRLWLISTFLAVCCALCAYFNFFPQYWYIIWGTPALYVLVIAVNVWLRVRLWWAGYQARLSTYQHKTRVNKLVEASFQQTHTIREQEQRLRAWERTRRTQEYINRQRTLVVSPKQLVAQIRPKERTMDILYEPIGHTRDTEPVEPNPPPAPKKVRPITAWEVISHRLMHSRDILLGFSQETGEPVYQSWQKIKSVFLAGLQGGGKTSSAVWLLIQVLGQGGRFVLVDKHARVEGEESMWSKVELLASAMLAPVGDGPEAALRALKRARTVFDARMDGGPIEYPLIVLVDEFTAIMAQQGASRKWSDVADYLAEFLADLNTEGRKVGCYAVCVGQAANSSRTGGTEIRDTFNTFVLHRMINKQPGLLGLGDYKHEIGALETGEAFIRYESSGECLICRIPYVDSQTIAWLAQRLHARRTKQIAQTRGIADQATHRLPDTLPAYPRRSQSMPRPSSSQPMRVSGQFQDFSTRPVSIPLKNSETPMKRPTKPVETQLPARAKRVLELKKLKVKKVEILRELWGVKPGATKAYQSANAEYEQIIESLVQLGYLQRITKTS